MTEGDFNHNKQWQSIGLAMYYTPYSMGFDPLAQSDTSYEVDALPPSNHGWIAPLLYCGIFIW